MKLEQTFTVNAQPATVWEALIDVARVAPCLPGAAITGHDDDGNYKGEFKVKLGPTTAAYNGVLKMTSVDDDTQVATMDARGTDKRGQGGATATIVSSVHAGDGEGETRVDLVTDFAITGRLARFGRGGMVQDVANRLLREFAANLEALLQAEGTAGAPDGDTVRAAVGSVSEQGFGDDVPAGSSASAKATAPPDPPFTPPSAAPVSGTAVLLGALSDRAKREPAQAAGLAAVLVFLLMVLRRRRD